MKGSALTALDILYGAGYVLHVAKSWDAPTRLQPSAMQDRDSMQVLQPMVEHLQD